MQLHPAQQSIWQTRGNLSPAAAFSASSPAPGIFSSANEPLANGSAAQASVAQASASAEAQAALTAAGPGSSASSNGISAAAYSSGLSPQLSSTELAAKLPSARGVSASSLFSEYLSKQQGEKNSVDYDKPTQSRAAISEYLLNQHAQRRDEIRAMVGVDLYA
ncbi:hypothetical protein KJI95_13780 [Shewanella sp. JM162201]|uniref:Uncharacterized protein n=1 Tax=Shewanella jiangmenensis TaxID=2837387 RepID=A0ABS5V551_9GAMM|nr:hypothetical protein [Shewanella jiangmenensis]MBT1445587.1 hypothetical protein [Shewanella jiangmenensis]